MHDNDPYCQRSNAGIDCAPKGCVYFDIVYCLIGDTQIFYQYADDDLIDTQYEEPVPLRPQEFEVEFAARWSEDNTPIKALRVRYLLEPVGVDDLTIVPMKKGRPILGARNTSYILTHSSPTSAEITASIAKNRSDYSSRRAKRHK